MPESPPGHSPRERYSLYLDFDGTFAPLSLASDRPIAMACFRLVTRFPLLPLFNVPSLRLCIARFTDF